MDLRSALNLDNIKEPNNFQEIFADIARRIMTNFVIRKATQEFGIVEIEFYYYSKIHPDVITYPRTIDAAHWFFHQSGVDLSFLSHENAFGGILLRGLKDLTTGNPILGPLKCVDALWDRFNAVNPSVGDYPYLAIKEDNNCTELHCYKRWIPVKLADRKKKISDWKKRIEDKTRIVTDLSEEDLENVVFESYYRFSTIALEGIKGYSARPKMSDIFKKSKS